jgi:hypothetical protein
MIFSVRKTWRILIWLGYMTLLTCFALLCIEYICRAKGMLPWKPIRLNITVTPGGKFCKKHSTLGYADLPGRFTVELPDGYTFVVTHRDNTLRITQPLEAYTTISGKPGIWIFGCSFTHGWALNDYETFPWLLQERLPQYEIVNFGVCGYSTLQSLIRFQEALTNYAPPKIAIIAYASFHDQRNTFLRNRSKEVLPYNRLGQLWQPYARLHGGNLRIASGDGEYRPFPLMKYSAFSHFLEQKYNNIEDYFYESHRVTEAIILEFAKLAQKHAVHLVVAGIYGDAVTHATLSSMTKYGVITGDISVDLNVKENTNLPSDGHPSAKANRAYCEKLFDLLDINYPGVCK